MKIIGITGGIGSGKSVVLNILKEEHNAYIIEADSLAHRLMEPGETAYKKIVAEFGSRVLAEDKTIDRGKMGGLVFHDREKLEKLNAIVHPAVKQKILQSIDEQRKLGTELFVIEAALLIQDGYKKICDELWYIYCSRELRIKRLMDFRGYTRQRAETVIASQEPEEFFREHCDKVLENQGDISHIKMVVFNILYQ
ncbi:MAG: dephospho-CoA kinase [Coprococcus sp.]|nr:dephospho-CoA kinase [Coprococcus sp.]